MARESFHLGRLAVHYKLITVEQLAKALEEQAKADWHQNLGDFLIAKGLITAAHLEKLLEVQKQMLEKQRADEAVRTSASGVFALPPAAGRPAGATRTERGVDRLLEYAVRQEASDLHL